jgi:hypothetical protein
MFTHLALLDLVVRRRLADPRWEPRTTWLGPAWRLRG